LQRIQPLNCFYTKFNTHSPHFRTYVLQFNHLCGVLPNSYILHTMKQLVSTISILFFCFLPAAVQAQVNPVKIRIYGVIKDKNKAAVPDVRVALLHPENNVIVAGDMTKDDGSFSIETATTGHLSIVYSAIGYGELKKDVVIRDDSKDMNLGTIELTASEKMLKGVEISGDKKPIEMSIDKKTFNVDKNITSAGGSAADMLQNVPSVTVDASGNVSMRGKSNVTVLIDGKPATLLGGDVASALQSLPAASIESVEVITNPSAKYDAQGTSGVLNIITKKDKRVGLNGTATFGVGDRDKYNGGVNMNLRNNKWNFALNSNFRINNNYNRSTTSRRNLFNDSSSYTNQDGQRNFSGWFNSLSAEYTIDKNNTISLTQNLNIMHFGSKGPTEYSMFGGVSDDLYAMQNRYEKFSGGPKSSSTNMNFKHKFKKPKRELTADVTFAVTNSALKQELITNNYDQDRNLLYGPVTQEIPTSGGNSSLNAQIDYSTPFLTETGKLEAGAKTQNFWFNSSNNPMITYPGMPATLDSFLLNNYNYNQQTHAGYVNFSDKKDKWSYQVGLRMEYAGYSGTAGSSSSLHYSNHFFNPFPSAYLAYQLDKNRQIYINYTKRTNRPFFMQMMPFLNVSNALDTTSGNPGLKPEFINNVELAYNWLLPKGSNFIASIYYQHVSNLIQTYTRPYADGTSFSQPVNLNYGATYGLELTGRAQMTKAWDAMLNLNFFQNEIAGSNIDPSINNSGFSWFGKLNTTYKITQNISVQLMGNYESAKPAAQGRLQEVYWVDAALKANFLKNNKASVTFNVTDIFNTRKYTTNYNLPLYDQVIYRNRETRIGTLTFSYKFGRSDINNKMGGGNPGGGRKGRPGGDSDNKKDAKDRDSNLKSGGEDSGNGGQQDR